MSHAIGSILFATDFSDDARRAQEHAARWAAAHQARLHVIHAIECPPGLDPEQPVHKLYLGQLESRAEPQLREVVAALGACGATVQGQLLAGIPSQVLTERAAALDSDLVIMGTRGLTGLKHVLVGSTAERVVRTAPCPVLAVRGGEDRHPPRAGQAIRLQRILAPVDFSDCSLDGLEFAISVARTFDAALTIQHVLEPTAFGLDFTLRDVEERRQMRKQIESWLSALTSQLGQQGLRVAHVVTGGNPADGIVARSQEQTCDLIVMGTHGRRGLSHAISGSVAEGVLRRAPSPVLMVKSPKFGPGHHRVLTEPSARLPVARSG